MLVGINGQVGSGKDTIFLRALKLHQEYGLPVPQRLAFADKLKLSASKALGVSQSLLEASKRLDKASITLHVEGMPSPANPYATSHTISVREYLQFFGTEVGRQTFGDNFWVDQVLPVDFKHDGEFIFVTDVRFPNEARRVLDLGGIVVRVTSGPLIAKGHASEQILDSRLITLDVDNSVRNDDFFNLDLQVRNIINYVSGNVLKGRKE